MSDDVTVEWTGFHLRVNFEYLGMRIDLAPAVIDLNPIYRAACLHYLQPAMRRKLGDSIDERDAEKLLVSCYARGGVIVGSPDHPYDKWDEARWESWLLTHRDEFRTIKAVAELKSNWNPDERAANADRSRREAAERNRAEAHKGS